MDTERTPFPPFSRILTTFLAAFASLTIATAQSGGGFQVTLGSSPNPSAYGAPIALNAAGLPPDATGSVTFTDGGTTLGTAPVSAGGAGFQAAGIKAGIHYFKASYSGDATYPASAGSLTQTVTQAPTGVTLATSANPAGASQTVTFTATVSPAGATGSVLFFDGSVLLGSGALGGGTATFQTSSLAIGSHTITAQYDGADANYAGSTTATALTQKVGKDTTTTSLAGSAGSTVYGQPVTFTATVSPATATGTVSFVAVKGGTTTTLGTGVLVSGSASFTSATLAPGTYTVTAKYASDIDSSTSTSAALPPFTVSQAATTTALASSSAAPAFGQSVTFTATVGAVAPGGIVPAGTVSFFLDGFGTPLGSANLSGGVAKFSTTALAVGAHTLTASYNGNTNFTGSASDPLAQAVTVDGAKLALSASPNPSSVGQPVALSATVTPAAATGTVSFFLDGAATPAATWPLGSGAPPSLTGLAAGAHTLTASYGGDGITAPASSATVTLTVKLNPSTTVLAPPAATVFGQPVTFTATVSPATATGTITFYDGGTNLGAVSLDGSTGVAVSAPLSSLAVGSHSIKAVYSGDGSFATSTATAISQAVSQSGVAIALNSSANPSVFGQSPTFTATVSAVAPGSGTPAGTVTFMDGATTLGSVTLDGSGTASLGGKALSDPGWHSITAVYGGAAGFAKSTSAPLAQNVAQGQTSTGLASSASSSAYGQAVTFTATVAAAAPASGTPTGTVSFYTDNKATLLGTKPLSGGAAAFSFTGLTLGAHSVTATYNGDNNFAGSDSTAATTQTVTEPTATTLASDPNPSNTGQLVTFTAVVIKNGQIPGAGTGTVTFYDGSTAVTGQLPVDGSGVASFQSSALGLGSHTMKAVFTPNPGSGLASSSATSSQTVNQATSTVLASSAASAVFGQPVTFTATVSGTAATTGGTVTFLDGARSLGSATLSGGTASLTLGNLAIVDHSITAVYGGSGYYLGSFSPALAQSVVQAGTSTALSASNNGVDLTYGQPVTYTATVSAAAPGAGTPAGSVTFTDTTTSTVMGSASLSGGVATFTSSSLAYGSHAIRADYLGSSTFQASSASLAEKVDQNSSTVTVTSNQASPVTGQSVTFTATAAALPPSGKTPTGTVTFYVGDAATVLAGPLTLSGGKASFTLSAAQAAGFIPPSYAVIAGYSGDVDFLGATSAPFIQPVLPDASAVTLSASPNPSVFNQIANLTATVSAASPGRGTPTGTVTFTDTTTGASLGGSPVIGGKATLNSTNNLALGAHTLTAQYGGDGSFTGSSSSALTQTVNQGASTTTLMPLAAAPYGQALTFTATVASTLPSATQPTGTVTFMDGSTTLGAGTLDLGNHTASFTSSTLAVGSHAISAVYGGDANYKVSTSPSRSQAVSLDPTSITLGSGTNPSAFGQPVTLTATVSGGPGGSPGSGNVLFKDGSATLASAAVSNGVATFTTTDLALGSHTITASFVASGTFAASAPSAAVAQVVKQPAASQTSLVSGSVQSSYGQPVTFTATVTSAGTMTGNDVVLFKDGADVLGSAAVTGGTASFTTAALDLGDHAITAVYGGDAALAGSTSPALTQSVAKGTTHTSLSASPAAQNLGQPVTFTATVTPDYGIPAQAYGTVAFKEGAVTLGSATLSGGSASFTSSSLAAGSHSITASYAGDIHLAGSDASAAESITNPVSINNFAIDRASVPVGGRPILSADVSGGTATVFEQINGGTPTAIGTIAAGDSSAGSSPSFQVAQLQAKGTYTYTLEVLDANNRPLATSPSKTVTVVPGVFDPSPDTMATSRTRHTSTQLPDGRILLAGGMDDMGTILKSVEIHDPVNGTPTKVLNLNYARLGHAATLLPDGTVLITGGQSPLEIPKAEIVDPAQATVPSSGSGGGGTGYSGGGSGAPPAAGGSGAPPAGGGTTSYLPALLSMDNAFSGHTATLLRDGTVLLAGGVDTTQSPAVSVTTVEIVTPFPAAGGFTAQAGGGKVANAMPLAMNTPRSGHTATLLPDGTVLIAGGVDDTGAVLDTYEFYNPGSSQGVVANNGGMQKTESGSNAAQGPYFSMGPVPLAHPRSGAAALLLPDSATLPGPRVLFAGGADAAGPLADVESYLMDGSGYDFGPVLHTPRNQPMATLLPDHHLLVAGGSGLASAETLDLDNACLSTALASGLAVPSTGLTANLLRNGYVYFAGGSAGNQNERFDPQDNGILPPSPVALPILALGGVPASWQNDLDQTWTATVSGTPAPDATAAYDWKTSNVTVDSPMGLSSLDYDYSAFFNSDSTPIRLDVMVTGSLGIPIHLSATTQLIAPPSIQVKLDSTQALVPTDSNLYMGSSYTASATAGTSWTLVQGSGTTTGAGPSFSFSPDSLGPLTLTATSSAGASATFNGNVLAHLDPPSLSGFGTPTPLPVAPGTLLTLGWTLTGTVDSFTLTDDLGDFWNLMTGAGVALPTTLDVIPTVSTTYTLTASNAAGTATSTFMVRVGSSVPPGVTITSQPVSQLVTSGQPATFTVSATANPGPATYVWSSGPSPIGPFTAINQANSSASYNLPSVSPADNGTYFQVQVSGGDGTTVTSYPALLAVSASQPTGQFLPTGAPVVNRNNPTSTLLPDGKVLVAGGTANGSSVRSTEFYDPATGQASPGPDLVTARSGHTATLLPNGQVLLAGGSDSDSNALASAELWDPASGTITATGSMALPRSRASASLLGNGKVLMIGGTAGTDPTTAELYDPASGTFTVTGSSPAYPRHRHTATVLADGKVLIAGGDQSGTDPVPAEIYDPAARTFTTVGSMAGIRLDAAAVLLPDHTVLVAGGNTLASVQDGTDILASMEIFDPATGGFHAAPAPMTLRRRALTATLMPDHRVLLAGGETAGNLSNGDLFDPLTGTMRPTGPMNVPRTGHTATLLPSGQVLMTGGNPITPSNELFDPRDPADPNAQLQPAPAPDATLTIKDTATGLPANQATRSFSASVPDQSGPRFIWFVSSGNLTGQGSRSITLQSTSLPAVIDVLATSDLGIPAFATGPSGSIGQSIITAGYQGFVTANQACQASVPAGIGPGFSWTISGNGAFTGDISGATVTFLPGDPASGNTVTIGCLATGDQAQTTASINLTIVAPPVVSLTASPSTLANPGDQATLTWSSTGGILGPLTNSLDGSQEAVPSSGTRSVAPVATTTYSLTAVNLANTPVTATAQVIVPRPFFTASPLNLAPGQSTTLKGMFDSGTGDLTAVFNDGGGNRAMIHDLGTFHSGDARIVAPLLSTPYTLNITDGLGATIYSGTLTVNVLARGAFSYAPGATGSTVRNGHSSTLLPDGRLLLIGGNDTSDPNGSVLASAELIDPATGARTPVGDHLGTARAMHTATLLPNGQVLVAGGYTYVPADPDNLAAGMTTVIAGDAELFTPAPAPGTGTFSPAPGSPLTPGGSPASGTTAWSSPAFFHTATLLRNGQVLLAGGLDANYEPLATYALFDLKKGFINTRTVGTQEEPLTMPTARAAHTASLLGDGQVLVTGGSDGLAILDSADLFDPATGFQATGHMNIGRNEHAAVVLANGNVLVAGGQNENGNQVSAEIFETDPASSSYHTFRYTAGAMAEARALADGTLLPNGTVLINGGLGDLSALSSAEIYFPAYDGFSATSSMNDSRFFPATTLMPNGKVLVTGGQTDMGLVPTSDEWFDPQDPALLPAPAPAAGITLSTDGLTASVPAQAGASYAWMTADGLFSASPSGANAITGFTTGTSNLLQALVTSGLGIPALGALSTQASVPPPSAVAITPLTIIQNNVVAVGAAVGFKAQATPAGSYSYHWSVTCNGTPLAITTPTPDQVLFIVPSLPSSVINILCTVSNAAGHATGTTSVTIDGTGAADTGAGPNGGGSNTTGGATQAPPAGGPGTPAGGAPPATPAAH